MLGAMVDDKPYLMQAGTDRRKQHGELEQITRGGVFEIGLDIEKSNRQITRKQWGKARNDGCNDQFEIIIFKIKFITYQE